MAGGVTLDYESLTDYDGATSYICPNENVKHIRSLVKGKRIEKAAGICSGGEVGFFAILPSVRKQLVLVDHSYRPLLYAILKYLLVSEYGFDKAAELISKRDKETEKALLKVSKLVPDEFKAVESKSKHDWGVFLTTTSASSAQYTTKTAPVWAPSKVNYLEYCVRALSQSTQWDNDTLKTMWADKAHGRRFARKLDKVKFVHGDMQALDKHGPFDLFYMSNAQDGGCNGNIGYPLMEKITAIVKPGGYIISAGYVPNRPSKWKIESKEFHQASHRGDIGWHYYLYRVAA